MLLSIWGDTDMDKDSRLCFASFKYWPWQEKRGDFSREHVSVVLSLSSKDTHRYRSFHISEEAHKLLGKCQQKWRKWQKTLPDLEKDIIFKFMSPSIRKNPRGDRNLWEQISHWSYCYLSQCSILLQLSDLVESGEFLKVSICEIKGVLELESKVLRIVLWF